MGCDYNPFASEFDRTRSAWWKNVRDFLDLHVSRYDILFDIGCGNGKYANYRNDITYIGCDVSEALLGCALKRSGDNMKEFICADGLRLPYIDKACDISISIAVLHHLESVDLRKMFIKEMIRVTRNAFHFTVWAAEQEIKGNWVRMRENDTDYLILWQNKYQRYYHLFRKEELIELLDGLHYEIKYECNNWCVSVFSITALL